MLTHFKNLVPQGLKRGVRRALTIGRSAEVGMTSPAEQRWYCDIAAKRSQQNGAIVDLGSWMGATAIALSRGVRRSAHSWGIAPKPVYAFDRYIWEQWMQDYTADLLCDYLPGETFLPEVRRRFAKSGGNILAIQADLNSYCWNGGPICILLVDAMKNPQLAGNISRQFYPALEPHSVLIHQDYKHYYTPCIHLLQYRLRDYFRFLHTVQGTGTLSFETLGKIPEDALLAASDLQGANDEEMGSAIAYSMNLVEEDGKSDIAAAHVMHFLHASRLLEAETLLARYFSEFGPAWGLKRVEQLLQAYTASVGIKTK